MRAWHGRQNVTVNPELIMLPEDRKDAIYRYLFAKRSATIHELATLMAVSAMTIRRDIKFLQDAGLVVGIHGGARLPAVVHQALPYVEKAQLNMHAKQSLGRYAASLVQDGQVVYLDAGTTSYEIARALGDQASLTVLTNDFTIAAWLMRHSHITLFHTGGKVDKRHIASVGAMAATALAAFNIDLAFLSASAWDVTHGLSTPDEDTLLVNQAVLAASAQRYLVADSSKYGRYSVYSVCKLQQLDGVITDDDCPCAAVEEMKQRGVRLHRVNRRG
ncbi:DeoR/GlpR family DNA-binding transcription regulator [Pantoea dispersa]|uniref:DeoR/GlpR family DNA-binding transcription regulator n=1 Tax=Pantoea dispersa TaxID=59814 RepID=UPI002DBDF2AD|nr:DeoR/GlpR family DNA-binding transcription regulator [Pantoea dispersa]MEB5835445.1 DeoR/GlpR family DNA-binding transcription regulator [Pantoea dispersa]